MALTATEIAPCSARTRYNASDALCIKLLDINIQEPRCLERTVSGHDTLHTFNEKCPGTCKFWVSWLTSLCHALLE